MHCRLSLFITRMPPGGLCKKMYGFPEVPALLWGRPPIIVAFNSLDMSQIQICTCFGLWEIRTSFCISLLTVSGSSTLQEMKLSICLRLWLIPLKLSNINVIFLSPLYIVLTSWNKIGSMHYKRFILNYQGTTNLPLHVMAVHVQLWNSQKTSQTDA